MASMPTDSVVLEEEVDPNYEPTEAEIIEYAKWLGMDPVADKDLLYLAKEGLKVLFIYLVVIRLHYLQIGNHAILLIQMIYIISIFELVKVLGNILVMIITENYLMKQRRRN